MKYGVGVDIGATYTRVVVADEEGNFLVKKGDRTVSRGDSMAITRQVASLIRAALREAGVDEREVKGIGIGSIGPLDIKRGIIVKPANLPFENVPLVAPLREEFGCQVTLVNDCVAAVIGERVFGAGREHENLVYVTISTGIGGGVYVDGRVLLGKDGNAHEIGHMVVDPEGRLVCGCGGRGHWEAYSSGTGIPNLARLIISEKPRDEVESSLLYSLVSGRLEELTAKHVYDAAKKGDRLAREVVDRASFYNVLGFANIISVYDPSLITVGGAVALNNPDLVLPPIKEKVEGYTINRVPEIKLTPLGPDVGLYGAVALALGLEEIRRYTT